MCSVCKQEGRGGDGCPHEIADELIVNQGIYLGSDQTHIYRKFEREKRVV